jgi:serine/threonine protein kinase
MISIDNNVWIFLGEEKKLSWDDRLQIAVDISHGIEYLHEGVCMFPDTFFLCYVKICFWLIWMCMKQAVPPVIHRDLKSPNILLDDSMRAKVMLFVQVIFDNQIANSFS